MKMELITLKRYKNNLLTVFFLFLTALILYCLFFINKSEVIKFAGTAAVILLVFIWIVIDYKSRNKIKNNSDKSNIKKFVLITRDGEREKQWHCEGCISLLIGKGTLSKEVDIELGDTYYAEYISNEHAVLNYSEGFWYIEDLNSHNGVGLKKKGDEYAFRLKPQTAYKLDEGDIIYISKAKLLAR